MVGTLTIAGSVVGAVAGVALGVWHVGAWAVVAQCEKPRYESIRKILIPREKDLDIPWSGKIELRRYKPYIVATVTIDDPASMRDGLGKGFMKCAGYIFGGNKGSEGQAQKIAMTSPVIAEMDDGKAKKGQKIAMTSPVIAEMDGGGRPGAMRVSFTMPSEWTMDSLPAPNDADVKLEQVPAKMLAAITWKGGSPKQEKVAAMERTLRRTLESAGVVPVSGAKTLLWQYDPPFSPPYMRTNEVLLEIDESTVKDHSE